MSVRPQSAQVASAKNQVSANSNLNHQKGNSIANGQVNAGGASLKNGASTSSRQRQQAQSLAIKRKKNQTPFSFYKDVCQKLNCNMNNAITHGLKGDELIINVDNLTSPDVDPMRVLLRECEFSIITLTGNKEFNEEKFYQEHEQIIFNYRNQSTISNTNSISKINLPHQNNFGMSSNGFQTVDERGRTLNQDLGYNDGHQGGLTPLGNHNSQKQRIGDASNKSQNNKDNLGGFKKLSNATAEGSQNIKDGANKSKKQKKNFSSQTQSFNQLMHSVGLNIGRASTSDVQLTVVKIINLNLKAESLAAICQGLQKSQTVKELYIQNCNLNSETIEKGMLPYIGETRSLNLLDLSFNKLDGQSGGLIGKLLSSHSKNRDEHIWLCGLRGEVPENNVNLEGICEVNLMGNLLTDSSIKDLCYFLQQDGWTRNINLRFNRIGADGLVELNKMLDNNENLISLDIRNNPGMTPNADDYQKYGQSIKFISKSIFNRLLNNIKVFKQKHDDMTRKQQEQIITNILYENNNQLPPNIFPQIQQDEAAMMMMASQNQQQQQQLQHPNLIPQQQNYLGQVPQQQQQQQLQLQQEQLYMQYQQQNQQQLMLQQQQQQQQDINYQANLQGQNLQQIQQEIQAQNAQMYAQQAANIPQEQQYKHLENQEDEYQDEDQQEKDQEDGNEELQQQEEQGQEELHAEEGDEELTEEQLLLKEKQNFVLSEEFIEIQQQNFANEYGDNQDFLNLTPEEQEIVFQQYLTHHQQQYLLELENEEQMEGVQEVQEEQYEEDDEEDENQPHDNHYNEQQIYYQQNEANNEIHEVDALKKNSKVQNQDFDQNKDQVEFQENEHDEEVTENNQNIEDFPQEIEEEEYDEEKIKQVMDQIYQNQNLEQIVDKNCKCCLQLQDKILQSEYEKLIILIKWNNCKVRLQQIEKQNDSQKASLKQQIQQLQLTASQQNQQLQQQQIANSWSAIQPNTMDQENNNLIMHPESFLLGGKPQQQLAMNANPQGNDQNEGEDNMLNRIEGLMTELTRLMDNLEIMQNNVTNNITCQLSNTTNTNNQTYHLLNSNPNINFNNTFTNILGGSHNNSNILPRNANSNLLNNLNQQTIIQQQQTSTFVPSQSSNNNTQIQQVSSTQSGQKKQKKNPQRQIVQQQYYQQQQQQPQQLIQAQQQSQQQKFSGHNNSR
ncbi:hypothetical protein TTHERM_00470470 (macronuclear) [Tetrahymena thermophila SB210]|uniref:Uncharacterized protein n=1 Tax=Tetrahymena thermophila (strain SB210) TaxID=312017 RepID=I7MGL0_TETTS|nr:hypothetical protein TTHERM_00470470 [Tetrahymena thermophila SB210]EAR85274.2 hypothetical protein TTHERM_00470470 [Tetrahymena thermophila SB210]|eukprot:XP_001032937.2 hypothetical protein TTHERM_00470470 [Tetrahymena thermophila SB210]